MSARSRRTAALVVSAVLSGAALLGATGSAFAATPAAAPATAAHGQLTVSDGGHWVLINGRWVNFGITVRDLAWTPNGAKAVFVDGSGNLDSANADGSGRVVIARNPGNQVWSHPTLQVSAADPQEGIAAKDNVIFTASTKGVTRLEYVSATAVNGKPQLLPLNHESGEGVKPLPQTGNQWPSAGGPNGSSAYANSNGDVYLRDDNLRQQGIALTQGSEPALSPSGDEVVFVRSVAGHDHILVENLTNSSVKDLTPHATTNYTEPAWSSDNGTLAVRTPSGTVTLAANGTGKPVLATAAVGLAAYRA